MSQIYIHIPFCDLKCNYCRFASIGNLQQKQIDFYTKNLIIEIKNSTFKSGILNSIYFGGGTPSVLSKNNLIEIFLILEKKFQFSEKIEITLESTPNNITKNNLEFWKEIGINRISIGIQTLNDKSLKEINRGNKGEINSCLLNLKKYSKIKNISIDFIIGLPYVKKGEILENIKFILNKYKFIKHISVYMLENYYSPDKIIETKYDNITYPDDWGKQGIKEEEYLGEYSSIKKYLINSGFNNYEISNYGKIDHPQPLLGKEGRDYRCKHNIGYWSHKDILAFGLGAYGFVNNIRYANSEEFSKYYKGEKIFENKLNSEDIFLEKVMFQLRTSGIEENIYKKLDTKKIDYFIENNYLENSPIILFHKGDEHKIKLTDKGVLVMDYILKEII